MKKLRFCNACNEYTLKQEHCGNPTMSAYPARFSLEDKYAKYRQKARKLENL